MMARRWLGLVLALLLLGAATSCSSFKIRTAMSQGNRLYKAEKYEEAIAQYKTILDLDPNHWGANYQIAMSYLAMYQPGSTHAKDREYAGHAAEHFETLLTKLEAPSPEVLEKVQNYYLSLLTSADRSDEAAEYLKGLLRKDPSNTGLMAQLSQLYLKQGDFPNALKFSKMKAELEPTHKENWYTIGVLCWARSYHGGMMVSTQEREMVVAEGMQALEKALALDSDYFDALSYLNLLYREQQKVFSALGKYEEAGQAYSKAEELRVRALEVKKREEQSQGGQKTS